MDAQLLGDPIPVSENVGTLGSYGWFSASPSGALAFRAGSTAVPRPIWSGSTGKGSVWDSWDQAWISGANVQLSPDGTRVAVTGAR